MDSDHKARIKALESQVSDMQSVVRTLQSRFLVGNGSPNVDQASSYQIVPSQQVTQYKRYDLVTFIFTDNSPIATSVSWTQGTLVYQGIAYPVAAGSTVAGQPYIYWQLANPYVFQTAAAFPILGPDDFIIGFNSFSPAGVPGFFELAVDYHNTSRDRLLITPNNIFMFNSLGNLVYALRRQAAGNNAGILDIGDGLGNIPIRLTGIGQPVGSAPVGAATDSLLVIVNGTTMKIALYP